MSDYAAKAELMLLRHNLVFGELAANIWGTSHNEVFDRLTILIRESITLANLMVDETETIGNDRRITTSFDGIIDFDKNFESTFNGICDVSKAWNECTLSEIPPILEKFKSKCINKMERINNDYKVMDSKVLFEFIARMNNPIYDPNEYLITDSESINSNHDTKFVASPEFIVSNGKQQESLHFLATVPKNLLGTRIEMNKLFHYFLLLNPKQQMNYLIKSKLYLNGCTKLLLNQNIDAYFQVTVPIADLNKKFPYGKEFVEKLLLDCELSDILTKNNKNNSFQLNNNEMKQSELFENNLLLSPNIGNAMELENEFQMNENENKLNELEQIGGDDKVGDINENQLMSNGNDDCNIDNESVSTVSTKNAEDTEWNQTETQYAFV